MIAPAPYAPTPLQHDRFNEPRASTPVRLGIFSRRTFGDELYTHALNRKPNIRLLHKVPFYFSPGAPALPSEREAGARF